MARDPLTGQLTAGFSNRDPFTGELISPDARYSQFAALRTSGRSVIATNLNSLLADKGRDVPSQALGAPANAKTYRMEHYAVADATDVRYGYGNWYRASGQGLPNSNWISLSAAHEACSPLGPTSQTEPRVPLPIGGRPHAYLGPGALRFTDPAGLAVRRGERFFSRSAPSVDVINNPPAAPTLTGTTGGTLSTSTTYYVAITYVTADYETFASAATSIATSTNTAIIVTSPAAGAGAGSYRVYCSKQSGGPWFAVSAPIPIGRDYTITRAIDGARGTNGGVDQTDVNSSLGVPRGHNSLGGTSAYGVNNGEGPSTTQDYTRNGATTDTTSYQTVQTYSPSIITGVVQGGVLKSFFAAGDSIDAGQWDEGQRVNGLAGWIHRGLRGETALAYTPALVPPYAYHISGCPGEKMSTFLDPSISRWRYELSSYFTHFVNQYGWNDLNAGVGLATMQIMSLKMAAMAAIRDQYFIDCTITPHTTSTDGYLTVVNQTIVGGAGKNLVRIALNSWKRSAADGSAVSGESIGTGDASTQAFVMAQAFVCGSEAVTVAGVAKVAGTDYNYTQVAKVNGVTYANGVTFLTAPANGAALVASYTSVPGLVPACGGSERAGVWDGASKIEVNSAGVLTLNGGYWIPGTAIVDTGAVTTGTGTYTMTDSAASWTASSGATTPRTPGYIGYAALTVVSSVPYLMPIGYNTATVLTRADSIATSGWVRCDTGAAATPASGSAYKIVQTATCDGIHPTAWGAQLMSAAVDTSVG